MLRLKNVNSFYGNIQVLKNLNIEISRGEIITLIGANGAGKTTTLMTISGLVPSRSGEITFMGKAIHNMRPDRTYKKTILCDFILIFAIFMQ
jgi:branched-chain amino acid transport system ATP-binding protein